MVFAQSERTEREVEGLRAELEGARDLASRSAADCSELRRLMDERDLSTHEQRVAELVAVASEPPPPMIPHPRCSHTAGDP